jgi:hypothetical protein
MQRATEVPPYTLDICKGYLKAQTVRVRCANRRIPCHCIEAVADEFISGAISKNEFYKGRDRIALQKGISLTTRKGGMKRPAAAGPVEDEGGAEGSAGGNSKIPKAEPKAEPKRKPKAEPKKVSFEEVAEKKPAAAERSDTDLAEDDSEESDEDMIGPPASMFDLSKLDD